jgi:uncharacterized membrane protein
MVRPSAKPFVAPARIDLMATGTADDSASTVRRGERRWLPSAVALALLVLPLALPSSQRTSVSWFVPVVGIPLVIAIVAVDPGRIDRRSRALRVLGVALTVVLVGAAITASASLTIELLEGAPQVSDATTLLWTGFLVWLDTNLTFALLYWELDGGGSAQRLMSPQRYPDFAFPQHMNPDLAPPGWMPTFVDYLYLGLTNALAFSPTDVMPLRPWAKLAMASQGIVSVAILSLVIANAVNLLG